MSDETPTPPWTAQRERFARLDELFDAASVREPQDRAAFLELACANDVSLRQELETLLALEERPGEFLSRSALEEAADWLTREPGLQGQRIAHYDVEDEIGRGGMGVVYRARDTRLGREVALKVLSAATTADGDRQRRFEQEARAASALNHPNVVTIYEIGRDGPLSYIAMELVPGRTVRRRLEDGPFSLDVLVDVGLQVARGLERAHLASIVHRDLKPENVIVTPDGRVKLLDFGLAKLMPVVANGLGVEESGLTLPGSVLGTVGYMSPEQAAGRAADARADQFSLGAILYEMATGRRAFQRETSVQTLSAIIEAQPEPAGALREGLPAAFSALMDRCLSKQPELRFESTTELVGELEAASEQLASRSRIRPPAVSGRALRGRGAAVLAIAIAVLTAAGSRFLHTSSAVTPAPESPGPPRSVAVLALEDASPPHERASEYLSQGLTEGLSTTLGRLGALRVIAPASVSRFAKSGSTPQEIARALSVDSLVRGRVSTEANWVHFEVELVDGRTGGVSWSTREQGALRNVQAVQRRIAGAIAKALAVPLSGADQALLAGGRAVDPEAQRAYLRGRHHYRRYTTTDLQKARALFLAAIEREPEFAEAYASLAECYVTQAGALLGVSRSEAASEGVRLAKRALELEPTLAIPHVILAAVGTREFDWSGAESLFQRALRLDPGYPDSHSLYSHHLSKLGRHDEAIAEIRLAEMLDPLSLLIASEVGYAYYHARRYADAEAAFLRAIDLDAAHPRAHLGLGQVYSASGRAALALEAFRRHAELGGAWAETWLAYGLARAGRTAEARAILGRLQIAASAATASVYDYAVVALGLGENQQALLWLEAALEERPETLLYLLTSPLYDPLRGEPAFAELLAKLRLPDPRG